MSEQPTSNELLPCPFCGSQPRSCWHGGSDATGEQYGYHAIECCDIAVHEDDEATAAAKWNKRHAHEPEEALDDHSELLKKLPNVRGDLLEELKPLSTWALIRRVLIQADWLGSYSRCIDGFEFRGIPGSGIDSARNPRDIRRIVEHLRASKPPELERYRRALQHIANEPLTDDPEASAVKCLEEATRIAREALAGPTKCEDDSNA